MSIEEIAKLEIEQLRTYREIYAQTDPPPQPPTLKQPRLKQFSKSDYRFLEVVGVVATGYVLSAAGGLIYSSIRTIGIFANMIKSELLSYGWNTTIVNVLVAIASVAIMLAVEGFLAAYGYDKGKSSGKISTNWLGVGVAFLLSVGAGFIASLTLVDPSAGRDTVEYWTGFTMAGLAALGVGLLVYFGCHNLGVIHTFWLRYLENKEQEIENYNNKEIYEVETYNARQNEEYQAKLAAWQDRFERDYRSKGRDILFGAGTYAVKRHTNGKTPQAAHQSGSVTDSIRQHLKSAGILPSEVGDGLRYLPSRIADELNLDAQQRKNIHTYLVRLRREEAMGQWNT